LNIVILAIGSVIAVVILITLITVYISVPLLALFFIVAFGGIYIILRYFLPRASQAFLLNFLSDGRSLRSLREQLSGDIQKARELKRQGQYDQALKLISTYLESDPEYPEAYFLRAQILYEGFRDFNAAEADLIHVAKMKPTDKTIKRWALAYYADIKADRSYQ
jgi:tetratricopeptide (TPR) repeat protein